MSAPPNPRVAAASNEELRRGLQAILSSAGGNFKGKQAAAPRASSGGARRPEGISLAGPVVKSSDGHAPFQKPDRKAPEQQKRREAPRPPALDRNPAPGAATAVRDSGRGRSGAAQRREGRRAAAPAERERTGAAAATAAQQLQPAPAARPGKKERRQGSAAAAFALPSSATLHKYDAALQRLATASLAPGWRPDAAAAWHEQPASGMTVLAAAAREKPAAVGKKRRRDEPAGEAQPQLLAMVAPSARQAPASVAASFREVAQRLLAAEVAAHEQRRADSGSADVKWVRTVLASGTASDKLAALTLLVQESPLHSLRHLDALLALAGKRSRREALQAVEAAKDLFLHNLLPLDRKLVAFAARPFDAPAAALTPERLLYWLLEDELKGRYARFIATLQEHLSDAILHFKTAALRTAYELVCAAPEQEGALLSVLVNKLGDPEGRVSSKAQHLLGELAQRHEAMKPVLVRELRQFLSRPHLSAPAQYHAVLYLSQLPLARGQPQLAVDLIATYFSVFELCVQRRQLDSRLLGALLTGINRAFPYSEPDAGAAGGGGGGGVSATQAEIERRADALFEVVHRTRAHASVQALALLQQVVLRRLQQQQRGQQQQPQQTHGPAGGAPGIEGFDNYVGTGAAAGAVAAAAAPPSSSSSSSSAFADRFYRALYAKIDLEELAASSRHSIFLNLVFRACRHDPLPARVRAVVKRLVQTALHMPAAFAAGVVFLVAELVHGRRDELQGMLVTPEAAVAAAAAGAAPAVAASSAVPSAHSRRRREGADGDGSSDSGGSEESGGSGDSGDGLHPPAPGESAHALAVLEQVLQQRPDQGSAAAAAGGGGVVDFDAAASAAAASPASASASAYDPLKRDPQFAGAGGACLWELTPLATHFHPSVRRFADAVLSAPGARIAYAGDPLADFTLMAFLDRYVYKNPKTRVAGGGGDAAAGISEREAEAAAAALLSADGGGGAAAAGVSREQIAAGFAAVQGTAVPDAVARGLTRGASAMQRRAPRHGRADTAAPATAPAFLALDPSSVAEEDRFMHTFFRTQASLEALRPRAKRRRVDEDEEEDADAPAAGRGRKRAGAASAPGGAGGGSDDEEAAMDRYADRLAEDLMRTSAGGGADVDDESWLDAEQRGDGHADEDEEEGSAAAGAGLAAAGSSDSEGDDSGSEGGASDGDDADFGGESGMEDEEEEEEVGAASGIESEAEAAPASRRKAATAGKGGSGSSKGGSEGVFASADDFGDAMAEEETRYEHAFAAKFGAAGAGKAGANLKAGAAAAPHARRDADSARPKAPGPAGRQRGHRRR